MFSKKFLTMCVALIATSALQMDYVITESQVAQQLTDMLSGLELGNMLSAGVDQNGSPTASVNFFGLTANTGANPLGQVQASAGLPGALAGLTSRRLRAA